MLVHAECSCTLFQVKNVKDHLLDNRMESFFLSETTKYLYLMFDQDNFIHNTGSSGSLVHTTGGDCFVDTGLCSDDVTAFKCKHPHLRRKVVRVLLC